MADRLEAVIAEALACGEAVSPSDKTDAALAGLAVRSYLLSDEAVERARQGIANAGKDKPAKEGTIQRQRRQARAAIQALLDDGGGEER